MKSHDEIEIAFRWNNSESYPANKMSPYARYIVVRTYGGTAEEAIRYARNVFSLGEEWELTAVDAS